MRAANDLLEQLVELLAETVAAKVAAKLEPVKQEGPRYYTRRQAKALLGLEVRAFDRAGRELGFLKPGRELLLPAEKLLKWIERQRVEHAEPVDHDAALPYKGLAKFARTAPSVVALAGNGGRPR